MVAKAVRSLSPKQILERTKLQRQAVMILARLAAKRAVQDQLRAQGVRVSLFPHAELMKQAGEYLASHPELYQLAFERAKKLGYIDPRSADIINSAQSKEPCSTSTISVRKLGAE